jgi:hypothetical protein
MWNKKTEDFRFGEKHIRYAAGDQFLKRGVAPGDSVFIVTVRKGIVYLGGVIRVKLVTDRAAAANTLGIPSAELWDASEFILPAPSDADIFRPNLALTDRLVDDLQLLHGKADIKPPKRDASGGVDRQTFRGIRRLAPGEEAKLEVLLA